MAVISREPKIAPSDGIALIDGLQLLVPDPRVSRLSRRLMDLGVTERDFTDTARAVTRPGDVVLDVGASIGYFTMLFSKWVGPSGRVLAHEPWPSARSYLLANVARNRLTNVTLDPRALADVDGDGHIAPPTYRLTLGQSADPAAVSVRAARFDAIADASALDRLDVVKMDIEGAEGRALAGMIETFRRWRPILLLEVHPDMLPIHGDDTGSIHRWIDELGYVRMMVEPDADPLSGHHLVAGPAERLAAAGIVNTGPRTTVLGYDAEDWGVAPGSPAEISRVAGGLQIRPLDPHAPGYVLDGPGWWERAPGPGIGTVRTTGPIWLTWDGSCAPGASAQVWVFEYADGKLQRRRSLRLPDGPAAWSFLVGPGTTAIRLALEVRGSIPIVVRHLGVEQVVAE